MFSWESCYFDRFLLSKNVHMPWSRFHGNYSIFCCGWGPSQQENAHCDLVWRTWIFVHLASNSKSSNLSKSPSNQSSLEAPTPPQISVKGTPVNLLVSNTTVHLQGTIWVHDICRSGLFWQQKRDNHNTIPLHQLCHLLLQEIFHRFLHIVILFTIYSHLNHFQKKNTSKTDFTKTLFEKDRIHTGFVF